LAVKIVRQPKKIALIGAPSSAAAFSAGSEKAPAALRAAGIADKLEAAGYEVTDYGDCAPRLFADDEEHKRARNLPEIVAALNDLKTRAELAVKSGALVLVLGGDCAQVIGLLTGVRRYYKHVNLLWVDHDADLNTPALAELNDELSRIEAAGPHTRVALTPQPEKRIWTYDPAAPLPVHQLPDAVADDGSAAVLQYIRRRPGYRHPLEVHVSQRRIVIDADHGLGDGRFFLDLLSALLAVSGGRASTSTAAGWEIRSSTRRY